jgi:hypothetical protein
VSALECSHSLIQTWQIGDLAPSVAAALGQAWVMAGRSADGLRLLEPLALRRNSVAQQARKADALVVLGRVADARAVAEAALTLARELGERANEALLLRILGDALLRDDPSQARACYAQGLALADALGLLPVAVRCRQALERPV